MSLEQEKHILVRLQSGDTSSFEAIVSLYGDKIARYLKRFLRDKEDIDDVWQEVFVKAYVNINSFEARNSIGSWLYRIAHNEALNYLRKQRPVSFTFAGIDPLSHFVVAKEDSHTETERDLTKKLLDGLLGELDDKHREILVLFYYEELSYKEISNVLRIPASSVGVRLSRAKEKILVSAKTRGLEH